MKIAIAATGDTLEGQVCERFGRCPKFIIVDSSANGPEVIANPASTMPGGAGPAAAQTLAEYGVNVVLAGEFGPKASAALDAAGIRAVRSAGPIQDAIAGVQSA